MTYALLNSLKDPDIPRLLETHSLPEIQCFIDINIKKYFKYVVKSENVFYYKIYDEDILVGSVHCELSGKTMYLSLLIFPEHQNKGYGTKTLEDIISKKISLDFETIEVAINDDNFPSLHLFEKVGFIRTSVDGGLINYTFNCEV
ncbi:MAG: GNAT family N-acetyltransferase [Acutalibacteraceae bacterium]|nr:GNAT family N-acetyltransferase [Acutalibacteraceae bacterium]